MPKTTSYGSIRLARVVTPLGPVEKTKKKDVAKSSSDRCAAPPTDEGPLIRFRMPVAQMEKMLARKRRAALSARAPKDSSTVIDFTLANCFKTPSPAMHFQLPLIRLELPLKASSGRSRPGSAQPPGLQLWPPRSIGYRCASSQSARLT